MLGVFVFFAHMGEVILNGIVGNVNPPAFTPTYHIYGF
jgi:hypothetical protein